MHYLAARLGLIVMVTDCLKLPAPIKMNQHPSILIVTLIYRQIFLHMVKEGKLLLIESK